MAICGIELAHLNIVHVGNLHKGVVVLNNGGLNWGEAKPAFLQNHTPDLIRTPLIPIELSAWAALQIYVIYRIEINGCK
jgi:hypothetical protein